MILFILPHHPNPKRHYNPHNPTTTNQLAKITEQHWKMTTYKYKCEKISSHPDVMVGDVTHPCLSVLTAQCIECLCPSAVQ